MADDPAAHNKISAERTESGTDSRSPQEKRGSAQDHTKFSKGDVQLGINDAAVATPDERPPGTFGGKSGGTDPSGWPAKS